MDDPEFELDFCTCINLMEGMSYEDAVNQAKIDIKEAKE